MLWAVLMKTTNLAIGKLRSRWSSSVGLSRYANATPCPRCVCSPHIHNTQISKHISVACIRIYICMFRVFVVRLNVDDDVCVIERRLLLLLLIASRDVHDATAAAAKLLLVRSQSEWGIRVEQDQQGKGWRGWKWRSNWWLFRPFCALIIMSVRIVYMEPVFIWMFIFFFVLLLAVMCATVAQRPNHFQVNISEYVATHQQHRWEKRFARTPKCLLIIIIINTQAQLYSFIKEESKLYMYIHIRYIQIASIYWRDYIGTAFGVVELKSICILWIKYEIVQFG